MSIQVGALENAVAEAKRFLKAADAVKRCAGQCHADAGDDAWYFGGEYCAAAKRASMDLSKALVRIRR